MGRYGYVSPRCHFPNWPVLYPDAAKASAIVGTPARSMVRPLDTFMAPFARQYRPVINWLRVGVHMGIA